MSMAAGRAVLRVIDQEQLQGNCAQVGGYLLDRLRCGSVVGLRAFHAVLAWRPSARCMRGVGKVLLMRSFTQAAAAAQPHRRPAGCCRAPG